MSDDSIYRSDIRASRLLLVTALAGAVVACQRSDLPVGVNYVPADQAGVVLNRVGDSWKVLVNGQDVTPAAKPRVVETAGALIAIDFEDEAAAKPLPRSFQLQLQTDSQIICQATPECPDGMKTWKRVEVR